MVGMEDPSKTTVKGISQLKSGGYEIIVATATATECMSFAIVQARYTLFVPVLVGPTSQSFLIPHPLGGTTFASQQSHVAGVSFLTAGFASYNYNAPTIPWHWLPFRSLKVHYTFP
jgi:hypothetical protein